MSKGWDRARKHGDHGLLMTLLNNLNDPLLVMQTLDMHGVPLPVSIILEIADD